MLCEPFLHLLNHNEENSEQTHGDNLNAQSHSVSHKNSSAEPTVTKLTSKSPLTPRAVRVTRPEGLSEKPGLCLTSAPSTALTIPSSITDDEDRWGPEELYHSWCCPSFCKAYPDLQLGGDTLKPHHLPPDSHKPHFTHESLGPLLQSQDLESLEEEEEFEQRRGNGAGGGKPDEGYLVMEGTNCSMEWQRRLTNSMLNGYLETQLLEVYCQHMQDSLARCPSSSLSAVAVVPALPDPSGKEGRRVNDDHVPNGLDSGSNDTSLRYLSTCSAPLTSHFSSPLLRISDDKY